MALVDFSIHQSLNKHLLTTNIVWDTLLGPETFRRQTCYCKNYTCIPCLSKANSSESFLSSCCVLVNQLYVCVHGGKVDKRYRAACSLVTNTSCFLLKSFLSLKSLFSHNIKHQMYKHLYKLQYSRYPNTSLYLNPLYVEDFTFTSQQKCGILRSERQESSTGNFIFVLYTFNDLQEQKVSSFRTDFCQLSHLS